ncbi:MAG TPA: hypothetical protein VGN08_13615 [Solirubrobacteraceae bacterium]
MKALRADPFERPLDALLERLRVHSIAYRPDFEAVDRWRTSCPCCSGELILHEPYVGSAVVVRCVEGECHESRIVDALAARPLEPAWR